MVSWVLQSTVVSSIAASTSGNVTSIAQLEHYDNVAAGCTTRWLLFGRPDSEAERCEEVCVCFFEDIGHQTMYASGYGLYLEQFDVSQVPQWLVTNFDKRWGLFDVRHIAS
jgi:hypothetical protein